MTRYAIGLDMGGTKCAGVLIEREVGGTESTGTVLATTRIATPTGEDRVVGALVDSALQLISESPGPVSGVGVGVPGLITHDGVLRFAPHLPGVTELRLADVLSERLAVPTIVANDNTCAAWGEYQASPGANTFVYIGFGTGIGGGVVSNGALLHGSEGFAAEFGHMVVEASGPECVCGRRGCWEMYSSGSGLARIARAAGLDLDGPGVRALLRQGSPGAVAVVETFARWVAVGLTNLMFAYDPDVVALGGGAIGLPDEAPELLEPIKRHLRLEFANASRHRTMPEIRSAILGPQAGAIGAAALALS